MNIEYKAPVYTGIVEAVAIGNLENKESRLVERIKVTRNGVDEDRHSGSNTKSQPWREDYLPKGLELVNLKGISAISSFEISEIAKRLNIPAIHPGSLAENLILSPLINLSDPNKTIPLSFIPPGAKFVFDKPDSQDTVVLITMFENPPCGIPGRNIQNYYPQKEQLAQNFKQEAINKRGLILAVEKEGNIATGDSFRVIVTDSIFDSWVRFIDYVKNIN